MSPATVASRKARGMRTQLVTALHLAANGWPHAQTAGSGRADVDILGVPGLSIEVKARRDLNPLSWIRQAAKRPGLPLVVFRPDGAGETTVGSWPCLVRFDDLIGLLRAAGYGSPVEEAESE